MLRTLAWAPTIALSWLWGLGFFFAFQMTLAYGWLGFAAFAVPNACGLATYGWVVGNPKRDPAKIFGRASAGYVGLFLSCQVLAVSITIFTAMAYVFLPLFQTRSIVFVAVLVLLSCAVGHAATIRALKWLHAAYLCVGIGAAAVLLVGLAHRAPSSLVPLASFDGRFYGLLLPALVGFLTGPWTDVQQWQRAVAIRADGASVRGAYLVGALLFVSLLTINAAIAAASGRALIMTSSDGLSAMQIAVAGSVRTSGETLLLAAYATWVAVVVASKCDSFYLALRWFLKSTASESASPLMAFVPTGLVTSPLPVLCAAIAVAIAAIVANIGMIYLTIEFATLLAGAAACLVCEVLGGSRRYDPTLCFMIGIASLLVFVTGYLGNVPALMAIAPIVALIGAFPAFHRLLVPEPIKVAPTEAAPTSQAITAPIQTQLATDVIALREPIQSHGFEGQWFVMHLTPTYDDTNSAGNVYFANYFRWIGKARELMFNLCMPDFDLKTTAFYIQTKSFKHKFRREVREFHPIAVRLKITTVNRKFVTIVHEIVSASDGLVGGGEQELMFIDTADHKTLDIPVSVLRSFMPYYTSTNPTVRAKLGLSAT